jgi:hypothetical protein
MFTYDGQDDYVEAKINKPKIKGACSFISVPKKLTMFHFDNYGEFSDNISCPICDKFPFEGSIETHEFAHVVFGVSEEKTLNGDE